MVEHFGATNFSNANQQATVNKRRDRVSLNREAPWVSMRFHESWTSGFPLERRFRPKDNAFRSWDTLWGQFWIFQNLKSHKLIVGRLLGCWDWACTKWEHHQVHDIAVWVLKLTHFNDDGKEIGWKAICKRHPERPKAIFPLESHLHGRANEQWAPLSHASVSLRKFFARKKPGEKSIRFNFFARFFSLEN